MRNNKKEYMAPAMEIVKFSAADIITTSGNPGGFFGDEDPVNEKIF